jgi:hypothetical protein
MVSSTFDIASASLTTPLYTNPYYMKCTAHPMLATKGRTQLSRSFLAMFGGLAWPLTLLPTLENVTAAKSTNPLPSHLQVFSSHCLFLTSVGTQFQWFHDSASKDCKRARCHCCLRRQTFQIRPHHSHQNAHYRSSFCKHLPCQHLLPSRHALISRIGPRPSLHIWILEGTLSFPRYTPQPQHCLPPSD